MFAEMTSVGRSVANFSFNRSRLTDPGTERARVGQVEEIFDRLEARDQRFNGLTATANQASHGTKGDGRMKDRQDRGRAMEQPRRTEFTADEFIAWVLEQPEGRFELDNGTIVSMAPERIGHGRAKNRTLRALETAIAASGLGCEAHPDGATVRIDDRTVYEPDALVRCGPPLPDDAIEVGDPVIVVEVVSPSSRGIDKGAKLSGYISLPSLRHYLIVDTDRRFVIHHHLVDGGRIETRLLHEGQLTLDPPGLTIEVQDIFAEL
jgi:Uma2 family endonuclease